MELWMKRTSLLRETETVLVKIQINKTKLPDLLT